MPCEGGRIDALFLRISVLQPVSRDGFRLVSGSRIDFMLLFLVVL